MECIHGITASYCSDCQVKEALAQNPDKLDGKMKLLQTTMKYLSPRPVTPKLSPKDK